MRLADMETMISLIKERAWVAIKMPTSTYKCDLGENLFRFDEVLSTYGFTGPARVLSTGKVGGVLNCLEDHILTIYQPAVLSHWASPSKEELVRILRAVKNGHLDRKACSWTGRIGFITTITEHDLQHKAFREFVETEMRIVELEEHKADVRNRTL